MNAQSATAVVKLFTLAAKSASVDKSYLNETMEHLQSKQGDHPKPLPSCFSSFSFSSPP